MSSAWQDMLTNVRHNLRGAQHIRRVRNDRAFRVHCIDSSRNAPVLPIAASTAFANVIRPLLSVAVQVWRARPSGEFKASETSLSASAWQQLITSDRSPPVVACPVTAVDWQTIASRIFDPFYIGGGERDPAFERSRQHAKRATARRAIAAFVPTRGLDVEVIASANVVEAWYREATARATLTSRMLPPDASRLVG